MLRTLDLMLIKPILILHRYLGVVLGVVMTVWCLSGFVMMYQGFPTTTSVERETGLSALNFEGCCETDAGLFADDAVVSGVAVEMLNGEPVLRANGALYGLMTGQKLGALDEAGVREVARSFAFNNGRAGSIVSAEQIKVDQWSIQQWVYSAPIWKMTFDAPAGNTVYVSGKSGQVVQDTNGQERLISWFGAIPHWLYPTMLRTNDQLWGQLMIWLSFAGVFLTVTGMAVGFTKLRYGAKQVFPYRRPMWWVHHVFGTFAGLLVLAWVFSGFLSFSPWGLFESKGVVSYSDFSDKLVWRDARKLIEQARTEAASGDLVQLRAAPLFGQPFMIAKHRGDGEQRIGLGGREPLTEAAITAALAATPGVLGQGKLEVLTHEDDYYYGLKRKRELPVYVVKLADADKTRIYLHHDTGELSSLAGGTIKRYRWLQAGLHDFDFAFMRSRPLWDIIVIVLLAAATVSCVTGTWLGFSRIGRDFGRVSSALRGGKTAEPMPVTADVAPAER